MTKRSASRQAAGGSIGVTKSHAALAAYRWVAAAAAALIAVGLYCSPLSWGTPDAAHAFSSLVSCTEDLSEALVRARKNPADAAPFAASMVTLGSTLNAILADAPDDDKTALISRHDVALAFQKYRAATIFSLDVLRRTLSNRPDGVAVDAVLLWRWIAATAHALTAVTPEFFLAIDETEAHGEALVAGLHLLQLAANSLPATAPAGVSGGRLVDCEAGAAGEAWVKFCGNTFAHRDRTEVRRAAVLEELIALHPDFAPLRLHYAVSLTLSRHAASAAVAAKQIRHEVDNLHRRAEVDPLHRAVVRLCEAFLSGVADAAAAEEVAASLRQVGTCRELRRPFNASASSSAWKRLFPKQGRPDVMDKWQARRLVAKLKAMLPPDGLAMDPESCGED